LRNKGAYDVEVGKAERSLALGIGYECVFISLPSIDSFHNATVAKLSQLEFQDMYRENEKIASGPWTHTDTSQTTMAGFRPMNHRLLPLPRRLIRN